MGLEMYLLRKHFLNPNKEQLIITNNGKSICLPYNKVAYVCEIMMCWRKASPIHKWFVDNVQNGVDDCSNYELDGNTLIALRETCQKVVLYPNLAPKLLPIYKGFFFNTTYEYDDQYFKMLKNTINALRNVSENDVFEYTSCW